MPQTLTEIRAMLESHGMSPRKRFGQNFLIDDNQIQRIVAAAGVGTGDTVLEVGPGTGTLTEALLNTGATVVAVEIDRGLCELLRQRLREPIADEQFQLIEDDVLAGKHALSPVVIDALGDRPFTLVANLPYNAASPLLIQLCTRLPGMGQLQRGLVMVQKEVAQRLMATPGTDGKQVGPLTLLVQNRCAVGKVATLGPGCFWPPPQIDSMVVELVPHAQPRVADPAALGELAHQLFSKRRKQIGSVLGRDTPLPAGIEANQRPEDLSWAQWAALAGRGVA